MDIENSIQKLQDLDDVIKECRDIANKLMDAVMDAIENNNKDAFKKIITTYPYWKKHAFVNDSKDLKFKDIDWESVFIKELFEEIEKYQRDEFYDILDQMNIKKPISGYKCNKLSDLTSVVKNPSTEIVAYKHNKNLQCYKCDNNYKHSKDAVDYDDY